MRRLILAVLVLAAAGGIAVVVRALQSREETSADPAYAWLSLPEEEKHPDRFEPYLETHPEDETRRTAAVAWYKRDGHVEKLKQHTFLLAMHHPGNTHIFFSNASAFYADPAYRIEVSSHLEKHVEEGTAEASTYWMLGEMYERGAVPPEFDGEAARERFLCYFGLPENAPLPDSLDVAKAETAATYYRRAMEGTDEFWHQMAAKSLVGLLVRLDKPKEAADICKAEIDTPHEAIKPDFLVVCGHALNKAGQHKESRRVLRNVRDADHEGFDGGPAHATTDAFTRLGLIAVELGDLKEASRMLLASTDVQKCCHNTTKGMPLELANRLFDAGEFAAVAEYCELVLKGFTPEQPETKTLLELAQLVPNAHSTDRERWWPTVKALGELARNHGTLRARIWSQAHVNILGMKFIEILPGTFSMGPDTHRISNVQIAHDVTLTRGFFISATEVTNAQFKRLFPEFESDATYSPDPDSPAVNISWDMGDRFCKLLSEKEGATYRLPTEAEWEYACRAGSTSRYCFGYGKSHLSEYAWCDESVGRASEAAMLKPNLWGVYDMHGNVFEWVADWYTNSYYSECASKGVVTDPTGPPSGWSHVLRSGPWATRNHMACTSTARFPRPLLDRVPFDPNPVKMSQLIGFRLVRELDEGAP